MIITLGENPLKKIIRETIKSIEGDWEAVPDLKKQIKNLKEERDDLVAKRNIEEQELKHLVKMKEEKQAIALEKEKIKLQHEHQKQTMDMQNEYHKKVLGNLEESRKEINNVYKEIMARLPNVNMEINRGYHPSHDKK